LVCDFELDRNSARRIVDDIYFSWIMVVHFYEGQSYSWEYSNRSYDDSGCWEDYLTPDEYEEALDRKRFEQSNRGW
jgi:hypothetical protein